MAPENNKHQQVAGALSAVVVLVVALLPAAASAEASSSTEDVPCDWVGSTLAPCLAYAMHISELSPACCIGMYSVYKAAKTTADKQAACRCINSKFGRIRGVDIGSVAGIPGMCVSYPMMGFPNCLLIH